MPKIFYKKQRPRKLFYAPRLEYHSTAYGEGVLREFLLWQEQFYLRWNARAENCLLSAGGDIGGAPVRCGGPDEFASGIIRQKAAELRVSASVLPALWVDNLFFEVEKSGCFVVNGNRTQYNLGTEFKAWAISDLFDRAGTRELFTVGKTPAGGKPAIAEYSLAQNGALKKIAEYPLDATAEPHGDLICFGRHVMLVYGKKLSYYYMAPESGRLERVPLGGAGDAAALYAQSTPVADTNGNVYWLTENGICTFRIGFPAAICRIPLPNGFTAEKICCRGEELYASGRVHSESSLVVCRGTRDGSFEAERIPVHAEILLGRAGNAVYYLSLEQRLGRAYAIDAHWTGRGAQETSRADMGDAKKLFYYFGDAVKDARYVGRNQKNETVCLQ